MCNQSESFANRNLHLASSTCLMAAERSSVVGCFSPPPAFEMLEADWLFLRRLKCWRPIGCYLSRFKGVIPIGCSLPGVWKVGGANCYGPKDISYAFSFPLQWKNINPVYSWKTFQAAPFLRRVYIYIYIREWGRDSRLEIYMYIRLLLLRYAVCQFSVCVLTWFCSIRNCLNQSVNYFNVMLMGK